MIKETETYFEETGSDGLYTPKRFSTGSYAERKYGTKNLPAVNVRNIVIDGALAAILKDTSEGEDKNIILERLKDAVGGAIGGAVGGAIGAMMPIPTFIVVEGVNWYSNHKTRLELEERINKTRDFADKNYVVYCEFHENLIADSVNAIDIINRKKTIAKECFLLDLYDELRTMGMTVTYSDFKSDFIDLRKFNVNEKYKEIVENTKERNKVVDSILKNLSDLILSPKKLKSKAEYAETLLKDNEASMLADLIKLECLSQALLNIGRIYTCIIDKLKPRLKSHLREMSAKYNHDMSAIPKHEKENLNKIKTILQEMANAEIVGKLDCSTSVDQVIETSNDLSDKFDEIKRSFAGI